MKHILALFLLTLTAGAADVRFDFSDAAGRTDANRVTLYPVGAPWSSGGKIVVRNQITRVTAVDGSVTFSNTVGGIYRSEFTGEGNIVTTNFWNFPTATTGLIYATNYPTTIIPGNGLANPYSAATLQFRNNLTTSTNAGVVYIDGISGSSGSATNAVVSFQGRTNAAAVLTAADVSGVGGLTNGTTNAAISITGNAATATRASKADTVSNPAQSVLGVDGDYKFTVTSITPGLVGAQPTNATLTQLSGRDAGGTTNYAATNLTGILPDAMLSTNVAKLNAPTNRFTGVFEVVSTNTTFSVAQDAAIPGWLHVSGVVTGQQFIGPLAGTATNATTWNGLETNVLSAAGNTNFSPWPNDVDGNQKGLTNVGRLQVGSGTAVAGYTNTLGGTTIATNLTATGSFSGPLAGTAANAAGVTNADEATRIYSALGNLYIEADSGDAYIVPNLHVQGDVTSDEMFKGHGGGLTNLSATNLTGTLPDARLSTNVVTKTGTNVFSGTNTFNGVTVMNGNVGIGTTAPLAKLHVVSDTYPVVSFERKADLSNLRYWGPELYANDTGTSDNGQGIGFVFKVNNKAGTKKTVGMFSGALDTVAEGSEVGSLCFATSWQGNDPSTRSDMVLRATGANSADSVLSIAGKVGINNTDPAFALDIATTSSGTSNSLIRLRNLSAADNSGSAIQLDGYFQAARIRGYTVSAGTAYGGQLDFQVNSDSNVFTTAMAINKLGNVGIGTTTPTNGTLEVNGSVFARSFESPTNSWAPNTPLGLGTNANYVSSTATFGVTGVANLPTTTERAGKLIIKASGGDVTFTNPPAVPLSDHLTSRIVTNGFTASLSVVVTPGFSTNGSWVHQ